MTKEDYLPMCSRIFSLKEPCLHFLKFCFKQSKVRFPPMHLLSSTTKTFSCLILAYSSVSVPEYQVHPSVCIFVCNPSVFLPPSVCLVPVFLSAVCASFLSLCVGNFSPAMGARNQVGIGLSYRPASLCSLATRFQTRS